MADWQTDRQIDRETDEQRDMGSVQTDKFIDRQMGKWTKNTQTLKWANGRLADGQTN
jgi:hypothetical protein